MTHQIKIVAWSTNCGDGCCSDYGKRLIINNVIVDNDFYEGEDWLIDLLRALNIVDYEITIEDEE